MSRAPEDPTPSGPGWIASPTFGVRVAGAAAEELEALTGRSCATAVAEHVETTDGLRADAAELCDLLHAVIGGVPEGSTRSQLVALRRAVHQLRPPGPRAWSPQARAALPAEVAARVDAWLARRALADEQVAGLSELVAEETARATSELRKAVAEPAFRFGLVLGSASLAAAVGDWVDNGKELRRSSLLRAVKYLARAAAKTSPYASFGFSGLGRWVATGAAVEPIADLRWHGVPELDRHTVEGIWSALALRAELRDHVQVRRNPSATEVDGRVRFLAAGPGEPVADAAFTDALRIVWDLAAAQPAVGEVVGRLEAVTGEPEHRCRAWVDDLVTVGLLERVRPFRDQDADPLAGIIAWLAGSGAGPFAAAVGAALEDLRAAVTGYPGLPDAAARARRLRTVHSQIEALAGRLAPRRQGTVPDKELVRENAVVAGPVVNARSSAWQPVLADLDVLRRFLAITDPHLAAAAGAAAAFRARFGAGATVGFLDCYRELHTTDHPLPEPLAELRTAALQTLFDGPRRGDGTIEVDPADVERLAASWPSPVRAPRSVSCFGQEAGAPDGPRLVVNAVRTGHGWGTSRIHHLLSVHGEDVPPLRAAPAPGSLLLAECPAAFGTTLNVRSAAVPHAIRYPGVEADGGIALHELAVGYDAERGRLVLRTAEGAEVLPLALGMLVEQLLPPALRFMVRVFGEAQTAFVPHVQLGTVGLGPAVDGVRRRPRLELGRLVLARAVACVPATELPRRAKGETDAGFLLRFAHWRHRHDLPQRCFVRTLGGRSWDKAHKPLYLDAASPLLLGAFDRSARHLGAGEVVAFEEVLPGLAAAPRYGAHGRRVTEYVLEVAADA
ncbi:lantibiotic dehydratase [Pseudonocardia cypriaca]|uniref:Lantibiotic biosynthesis dehydratase-like protein n=1 Tax=Pseudonocardia cypriaca TaxID=882449 RepID=A0A543FMS2_9PSEU|nr:lantibiotic dehydratase [Pseudonocardia cypriaca]TQM35036.1 lantibiotic biosynthesis dehydratase-like protein [Pseudonocardia cypriaca]